MLALWALSSAALAGPLEAELAEVRALIVAGEPKGALKQLKQIEASLSELPAPADPKELASVWLYRGAAEHLHGPKKERDINAWRQALVIDNSLAWDPELIDNDDMFSLFEALRGEVRSRPSVSPALPEATGAAVLYIDGVRMREDESLLSGLHLAQITCPDKQGTFGLLTDLTRPPDWLDLCPDGVDTSVVVAETGDEWAEFGPAFGTTPAEEPVVTPEYPIVSTEDLVTEAPSREPRDGGFGAPMALLTGGGVLVAVGSVVNFAIVNPAYSDIEAARDDPFSTSRSEADALTARFDRSRYLTMGLIGAGVATAGVSFFIDAPLRPVLGLGHLGVTGQF
jgi:hypothetical protein